MVRLYQNLNDLMWIRKSDISKDVMELFLHLVSLINISEVYGKKRKTRREASQGCC